MDVEAAEPLRVNETGIVTADGRQIDLDVIIYATGYYLISCPPWTSPVATACGWPRSGAIFGRLPWRHGARFPNLFISLGAELQPRARCRAQFRRRGVQSLRHGMPSAAGESGGRAIEVTPVAHEGTSPISFSPWRARCGVTSDRALLPLGRWQDRDGVPVPPGGRGTGIVRRSNLTSSSDDRIALRQTAPGDR